MYNLELVNWYLSKRSFIRLTNSVAGSILNQEIGDIKEGLYIGKESSINSSLLYHLASAGYYANIRNVKGDKILDIWIPDLIVFKRVDWSILNWGGTTISQVFHPAVNRVVGRQIERGENLPVTVFCENGTFEAKFRNVDRKVASNTYQFMFNHNKELITLVREYFGDVFSRSRPNKPVNGSYYFEILSSSFAARAVDLNLYNGSLDLMAGLPLEKYLRAFKLFGLT